MTYGKGAGINGMPKLFGQKELSEEEADSSAAEEEEKREKKKSKMKKLKINKKEKKDDIDDLGRMASLQNERDLKSIFQNIANMNKMTRPSLSGARVREAKDPKEEKKEEIDPFGRVQKSLVSGEVYENDRKEGDLTFGSYIVISIENEKEQREKDYDRGMKTEHRKFFSKFRISDVVKAEKMSKENYDSNCVFRIIPAAQFSLMNKLREIVTEEIIPQNFELDYENFISEMEDSVDTQDDLMGKPIKYGSKFQLVQESSKRFLSMSTSSSTRVAKIFNNRYVDSQCYDLCFSEYPSMFTHFQFEECSNFQREGNGNVSVDHFFYLSSKIKSKSFYAYNSDKYLVMTQSYKTPLYYNLVRESGTFNEIEDVQTSEVVLIAYANEDYFLNVPHRFDPASGQYIEQNIAFENTRDFNSWFMVEYDEEKQIVHLKHFNTGKYVSIENSDNLEEDVARLVGEVNGERIEETEIIFEPVNTTNTNVSRYTDQCVFKIRANNKGKDNEDNYIRFANEYDREKFGQENDNIFEENDSSKVPLVVRDADSINKYDTFKLIFPTDDTYRELIFCKDSTLRLKEIFKSVDEAKEINEALEKNNHALYKVFLKVYKFVTNDLEGRTNSDYDVDEIVDYRQEMVAKAGFLNQIFDFLDYWIMINKNEDEEWYTELQTIFKIAAQENNDFENLIELVFETMYVLFEGNSRNQLAATHKIETMQQFVFVPNITKVLIVIFKDKQFEMNKKEIHTEILYRRIYEFERFQPIVDSFIQKLKKTQNSQYIFILRKIWLIDGNPLPLIQKEIFNTIYQPVESGESWDEDQAEQFMFGVSFEDDTLHLTTPTINDAGDQVLEHPDGQQRVVSGEDFTSGLSNEEKNFVLDQLALEADLCFGRNRYCNKFFKRRYPVQTLIRNIINERIPKTLKAVLVRIFTSLYIDDHPHRLLKVSRCYKAYQSGDDRVHETEFERSDELSAGDLNDLFEYINKYFFAFAKEARGPSHVKPFEMELVKWCKFMLKFGIFTHRNNEFQVDDIDDLFSFLCHILDIFTNRKDFESRSLDLIAQKDEIIEDYTQNNPIQKAAHDIKYRILNKKDWKNTAVEADLGKSKEDGEYRESHVHSKIILEIMEIFHFLFDLRQNYLMENIVEMFHKRVFTRNVGEELFDDEKRRTKAIASMVRDFKKVLPDNSTFSNQLKYNFPSVDEMYEDKEFEQFREEIMRSQLGLDMHDDFLVLLMDTFNVSSGNKFLQQMTLTIICRYYSERSELVRNIDRMCLLFDENEWKFYQWVNITIDMFTRDTEKSVLWLNEDDDYNDHDLIDRVNGYLFNLRAALNQKYQILDSEGGGYEFVPIEGERKINKFAQRVFRSLKVYDHLINFIMKNKKLLIKVRTTDDKEMGETERLTCNNIEKIFRRCLKILEAFTMSNKINQGLMWKYKEIFVFPELGSSEEDGELEFILSIVDQNDMVKVTRPLDVFISCLNQRMGHESNFVILLDIFNKLMDFESNGKIKKSLTKLILERKDMLEASKSPNSATFEASINVKEILLHILQNQELSYAKDSFIECFPLEEFIDRLVESLDWLDKLQAEEEDDYLDEQDYEELRESQQIVIIELYSKLHFNKDNLSLDFEAIADHFNEKIDPYYHELLDKFNYDVDLEDKGSYKLSEIKLIVLHLQILIKNILGWAKAANDKLLSRSDRDYELGENMRLISSKIDKIGEKLTAFLKKLRSCKNDDISDLLNQILGKESEDDELNEGVDPKNISVGNSMNKSAKLNLAELEENGSATNISFRISHAISKAQTSNRRANNIKIKNRRSKESIGFGKCWAIYVDKICNSRVARELSNQEQDEVTTIMFDQLTKKEENENDRFNVMSLKKFIANAIDYSCDWENATWTVYLVIFIFKLFGNLCKKWEEKLTRKDELDEIIVRKINTNILDIMDTLRNCNYIFGVLCEVDDANIFQDEIFMITLYFFNKLLIVRTNSVQLKLEGVFKNHSGNQAFFNQLNRYLHSYTSKIRKNVLQPFFAKQKYTDELSEKSYYIDKNLEKQIIDFLRLTCKNGNRQMQNYMKKQSNNTRSFNMIYSINDLSKELLTHLHYPVAFDTYISCLRCILEFIQGPNRINQTILINNDFVPNVAVQILALGYHEDEAEYGDKLDQINKSLSKGISIGMTKSRLGLPSISVGKSSLKQYGNIEVTMPTTNYMISLAKYWILLILNHLTDGYEPSDYIYYIYRREINPDIFRQNFAFQRYFFQRFNKDQYKTELFFSYYQNINSKKSPMIIEIGFELYFLIKKIEENIKLDYDERYTKSLIKLLPKWDKPQIKTQSNFLFETLFYFIDMSKAFLSFFRTSTDKISFNQIRKYAQNDTQIRATLNFFENKSAQIEIYKQGKLQKFWFPRLPYWVFQNSDVKDEFLQNVNRTDSKTKCNDLVRSSKIMLVILKIDYFLRSRLGNILGLIVGYIELWKKYLQLLAVVINVLIILSYNTDLGSRFRKPSIGDLDDTETLVTIRALGIVNLILAIIVVGVLMAQRIPYNIQKFRVRNQDTNKRLKESGQVVHEDLIRNTYIKFNAVYETTKLILFDVTLLYHMIYFFFIVLGVTYHPFFFSISLTYLIVSSPVLINVLKAVYEPRIQIILTLFLTIIVYYVFSIFSYMIFHSDYNESLENACYSLWSCLFITIDQSYKNDGAIGGFLPLPFTAEESEIKVEWSRFFYDYIFNLVIAILLTEILSGIIIDKFSELRESNEEKRKDEMSECFICGQTREELEKKLGYNGFKYHTIFQHNMWDYLFFIGYLKNKKNSYVNDYMESERYVLEKLEDDENNWMPCYA